MTGYSQLVRYEASHLKGHVRGVWASCSYICLWQAAWALGGWFGIIMDADSAPWRVGAAYLPCAGLIVSHALGLVLSFAAIARFGPVTLASVSASRRLLALAGSLYMEGGLGWLSTAAIAGGGWAAARLGELVRSRTSRSKLAELV